MAVTQDDRRKSVELVQQHYNQLRGETRSFDDEAIAKIRHELTATLGVQKDFKTLEAAILKVDELKKALSIKLEKELAALSPKANRKSNRYNCECHEDPNELIDNIVNIHVGRARANKEKAVAKLNTDEAKSLAAIRVSEKPEELKKVFAKIGLL